MKENIERLKAIIESLFNKMTHYNLPNGKFYIPLNERQMEQQKIIFNKQMERKLRNQGD